ncbi:DUF5977 domain-containing protein [Mucilaginibacter lutimaris]|uniref:DUF5977 domain-containing protein n=1 Tax=Mucilaginibacter lutimaris TaxID=931629 RepID=A0ABW2ZGD5_9SPHI
MIFFRPLKGLLAFTVLFCCFKNVTAQTSDAASRYGQVSITSPTPAALAKFVDIPVSLHTGIPQISIPLYTIKDGALSLSLSMSYHAGGLKTMEPAGWTGAGWALNAGGVITRSVRGTPDEAFTVNSFQKRGYFSDYGARNYLYEAAFGTQALYDDFKMGYRDGEPDLFFFNFNGYSGKFYFNDDRMPMLLPEQDIKIEYNYPNSTQSIQGFTLTTPDGVKYYFGATPSTTDVDPVETSNICTSDGIGFDKVISSWYLNKIESPDGINSITLNYQTEEYGYHMLSFSAGIPGSAGYKLIKNYVKGVRLSNITSSNCQINFVPSDNPRQDLSGVFPRDIGDVANTSAKSLYRIDILNKDGVTVIKKFRFNYDYFSDLITPLPQYITGVTTDQKRLKLLSIQEEGRSAQLIPPYKFEYFDESVPRRLSFGQDHWGFINGASNATIIGTYTNNNAVVNGANRDPAFPAMRGGTLKKIIFPTGGYNVYDYEANQIKTTSASGTNLERQPFKYMHVGFDGCQCVKDTIETVSLDYHLFVFSLSNRNNGGLGQLKIYNSSHVLMDQISAQLSQTVEITRNYPPGVYTLELIKFDAYGGQGAELNVYMLAGAMIANNAMVGGLRIKSITQAATNGNPDMVTDYDYTEGQSNLTSGVLFGKPAIVQIIRNEVWRLASTDSPPGGCITSGNLGFLVSPVSIRPMDNTQGSHVGYKRVKTSQQGNGSTVSIFDTDGEAMTATDDIVSRKINSNQICDYLSIPNYPAPPPSYSYNRGQLIYKADLDNNGVVLRDVTYQNNYIDNPVRTPALTIVPNIIVSGWGYPSGMSGLFTWYEMKTGHLISTVVVNHDYTNEGGVSTQQESYFESPFHRQLTRKLMYNSTGETLETKYLYTSDFRITNQDNINNGITTYENSLYTHTGNYTANYGFCTDATCRKNTWIQYDKDLCLDRQAFINTRRTNLTNPGSVYNTTFASAFSSANTDLKPLLDMRLQNNLALVETVNLKNGNVLNATYNTYAYKPGSGNKVYLSKINKADFLTSPATFAFTKTATDNISVVKDASYTAGTEKAFFEYASGNITEVKLKDNTPTSYQWGYNGQYPVASAKNARSVNIFFESFEEGAGSSTPDDSKTGHYSKLSGYSKALSGLDNGAYTLTYYQKVSGIWQWVSTGVTVSGGAYTISIPGQVDDVRFAPSGAMVTSYTYDPQIGMTSSMDQNGVVTYYEYDSFQRLKTIRDKDKNILKSYCYNYAGQQGACDIPGVTYYYNTAQSQPFNRAPCQFGTGSSVTYTVKDSMYVSTISVADANAQAQADIAANGQNYANANGTCPPELSPIPYARIEQTGTTPGNPQNYASYRMALYADAGYTVPFVTTQNLVVNYRITTSTVVSNGTPTITNSNTSVTILANNSTRTMGSFENGCGVGGGGEAIVAGKGVESSAQTGGGTTNLIPPGGGTTCVTKSLMLLPGTGYYDNVF